MMTLTEAFSEIEVIDRHLTLKRAFLLALALRPATLRDPLASDGGSAAVADQELKSLLALQEHRLAVRRAIRVVAQQATITLGSQTRTIADWLEWRRAVAPEQSDFLSSLRERIRTARQEAEGWNYALPAGVAAPRDIDLIVNVQEPDLARQSEFLEETSGALDGQLSLKSAILSIDIASLSESLIAQEAQLTTWLKQIGKDSLLEATAVRSRTRDDTNRRSKPDSVSAYGSVPRRSLTRDYEIPDDYDAEEDRTTVPVALWEQVRGLLAGGRKIEAIRLVRERTGWPLLQVKQAVEAFQ